MYHIVFNADSNYIKYTAVLIQNIVTYIDKSKDFSYFTNTNVSSESKTDSIESFHFHIITDDISQDIIARFKLLESSLNESLKVTISIHNVSPVQFLQQNKWGFEEKQSYAAYYRILVDKILPKSIDKILYIDTDMLVLCDIRELFAFDMQGKIIAANSGLPTPVSYTMKFKSLSGKKPLKIFIPRYFCSGLMLIDMQLWRAQDIESKCLDFLSKYESHFADQDALNVVVQDSAILPPQYGIFMYQYTSSTPRKQEAYGDLVLKAKIMHCNGAAKAWSNYFYFAPASLRARVCGTWWDIARQTSGFTDIFSALQKELNDNAIGYCVNRLNKKINELESKLYTLRHPHKAILSVFKKIFR